MYSLNSREINTTAEIFGIVALPSKTREGYILQLTIIVLYCQHCRVKLGFTPLKKHKKLIDSSLID